MTRPRSNLPKALVLLLALAAVCVAEPDFVSLDIGFDEECEMGFGWYPPEFDGERTYAWIGRTEADVGFSLRRGGTAELEIHGVPFYVRSKVQQIGVYVNDRFVGERTCAHRYAWVFESYRFEIPSGILVPGRNRITLRMGYVEDRDGVPFALAVDYLRLRFRDVPAADGR